MYHSGLATNNPRAPTGSTRRHRHPHPPAMLGLPFTDECRRILLRAADNAAEHGDAMVEPTHLLYGIAREDRSHAAAVLADLGADLEDLLLLAGGPIAEVTDAPPPARSLFGKLLARAMPSAAHAKAAPPPPDGTPVVFSPRAKRVVDLAASEARSHGDAEADSAHLLVGLLQLPDDRAAALLSSAGADLPRARDAAARRRARGR